MINKLNELQNSIRPTPCIQLVHPGINLFAKLEYMNVYGSIKDRAAFNIIYEGVLSGQIDASTTIIESSSGNMAIALANICNLLKLKFIAVIDVNINAQSEELLNLLSYKVIKVTEMDKAGGYLLNRIDKINEMRKADKSLFWTDQYRNPNNYLSYVKTLGQEICDQLTNLDYVFVAVSSCGTVTGLSIKLRERFPNVKIIAVDVEGSVIFGTPPKKRFVSGLGSSLVPEILSDAKIDEVIHVPQLQLIDGCYQLLKEQTVFAGGSTGAVYFAIKRYFQKIRFTKKPDVLFLCVDRGTSYLNTIYNKEWVNRIKTLLEDEKYAIPSKKISKTLAN